MDKKRLVKAASIFESEGMEGRLSEFPDEQLVHLGVMGRKGCAHLLTLGELREFWRALREAREQKEEERE